jgi:hypothetical protein
LGENGIHFLVIFLVSKLVESRKVGECVILSRCEVCEQHKKEGNDDLSAFLSFLFVETNENAH